MAFQSSSGKICARNSIGLVVEEAIQLPTRRETHHMTFVSPLQNIIILDAPCRQYDFRHQLEGQIPQYALQTSVR